MASQAVDLMLAQGFEVDQRCCYGRTPSIADASTIAGRAPRLRWSRPAS
jgi:hypothetical protein